MICRLFTRRSWPDQRNFGTGGDQPPIWVSITASRPSGLRVSVLRVHSKSPVAMPWVPSPQRLDRLATSTCLDRSEPIGFWGEGGPWPTTRGHSKWSRYEAPGVDEGQALPGGSRDAPAAPYYPGLMPPLELPELPPEPVLGTAAPPPVDGAVGAGAVGAGAVVAGGV